MGHYATTAGAGSPIHTELTAAYLQDVFQQLSMPPTELRTELARAGPAAVLAWADAKLRTHPAQLVVAGFAPQLAQLGSLLRSEAAWSAHASAAKALLRQVAASVDLQALEALPEERLGEAPYHAFAAAAARRAPGAGGEAGAGGAAARAALVALAHRAPRLTPLEALQLPDFWRRLEAAAAAAPDAAAWVSGLAAPLEPAVRGGRARAEALAAAGADVGAAYARALATAAWPEGLVGGGGAAAAAAADSAQGAVEALAELRAAQWASAQLGAPACSAMDVVGRLLAAPPPLPPALPQELAQALAAALPELVAAAGQLPVDRLASEAAVEGVLAATELAALPPAVQALLPPLRAWRAEQAAAGNVELLVTLTREELLAMDPSLFRGVREAVEKLDALAQQLPPGAAHGVLTPHQAAALDTDAVRALAWRVHSAPGGALAFVEGWVRQAAALASEQEAAWAEGARAIRQLRVAFGIEKEVARLSTAARPEMLLAGEVEPDYASLQEHLPPRPPVAPGDAGAGDGASSAAAAAEVAQQLASFLDARGAPLPRRWREAAAQLGAGGARRALPPALREQLGELLAWTVPVEDAAAAEELLARARALLRALDAHLAASDGAGPAPGARRGPQPRPELQELLGEDEATAAEAVAAAGRGQLWKGGPIQPFEVQARVHHDIHMQNFLRAEFDPFGDVALTEPPRPWRDPQLWQGESEFLGTMRPLLDSYLEAYGAEPLNDLEFEVYREASLAEHYQQQAAVDAGERRAGASGFSNSAADEAYLRQRLEAALPPGSPLAQAARKYLAAVCDNPSWSFAQRRHMVDRLGEVARHLQAHPPRGSGSRGGGSPFSPLFQPGGPPLVPRLSREFLERPKQAAGGGDGGGVEAPLPLPSGFGRRRPRPAAAKAGSGSGRGGAAADANGLAP